jgi:hypothetical protein
MASLMPFRITHTLTGAISAIHPNSRTSNAASGRTSALAV